MCGGECRFVRLFAAAIRRGPAGRHGNTLGIVGMGRAIQLRRQEMAAEEQRLLTFKHYLRDSIARRIDDVQFNGHPDECLAGTLNVSVRGCEGEALLLYLDLAGIAVSTGSACSSGSLDPSHVLWH